MRDLAVQASNDGALSDTDKAKANEAYQALAKELDDIASKTTFNGTKLLDGSYGSAAGGKLFQIGPNACEPLGVTIRNMSTSGASSLFGANGVGTLSAAS